jgi:putrescine aminotransferase
MDGSFHGVSFGGLSITGRIFRNCFEPLLPGCENVPFCDLQALEAKLKERNVAAFIVEPLQAEGGCNILTEGYLAGARELCSKYDALLIFDEIQTGFGRTGKMFAAEHEGVQADIFVVGKAFTGGVLPLSASVTSLDIWKKAFGRDEALDALISTFRGNPKACAAALKTIEILVRDNLVENSRELGEYTLQRLHNLKEKHKNIKQVRGLGLISGIEFFNARTADYILSRMLNKYHVVLAKFDYRKDMLRLQPPLTVKKEEIDYVIDSLDEACSNSSIGLALGAGRTALGRIVNPPK